MNPLSSLVLISVLVVCAEAQFGLGGSIGRGASEAAGAAAGSAGRRGGGSADNLAAQAGSKAGSAGTRAGSEAGHVGGYSASNQFNAMTGQYNKPAAEVKVPKGAWSGQANAGQGQLKQLQKMAQKEFEQTAGSNEGRATVIKWLTQLSKEKGEQQAMTWGKKYAQKVIGKRPDLCMPGRATICEPFKDMPLDAEQAVVAKKVAQTIRESDLPSHVQKMFKNAKTIGYLRDFYENMLKKFRATSGPSHGSLTEMRVGLQKIRGGRVCLRRRSISSPSMVHLVRRNGEQLAEAKLVDYQIPGSDGRMRVAKVLENLYHGTSAANADSIMKNGFRPGQTGTLGPGVYLTPDLELAKAYAGKNGKVLHVSIIVYDRLNVQFLEKEQQMIAKFGGKLAVPGAKPVNMNADVFVTHYSGTNFEKNWSSTVYCVRNDGLKRLLPSLC